MHLSPRWLDLNLARGSLTRQSRWIKEQPTGQGSAHIHQDAGDGILRSHPSLRAISMPIGLVSQLQSHDELASRSAPFPKLEFPKFDGSNHCLWRDLCERYFEVYSIVPFLKTWFAALNFTGPALD